MPKYVLMYRERQTLLPRDYISEQGHPLKIKSLYCTDFNFADEDVKEFTLHTMRGKIFITPNKVVVPQVYNEIKNNGAFAETMKVFLQLSHDLQRDLWVVNFMNKGLKKHLVKKWGFICKMYEPKRFDGVYYPWEKTYED